jgi:hypothetical protein
MVKNKAKGNSPATDDLKTLRDSVKSFVKAYRCPLMRTVRLEKNPFAEPGQALFKRFLRAKSKTDVNVRLCFHGDYFNSKICFI